MTFIRKNFIGLLVNFKKPIGLFLGIKVLYYHCKSLPVSSEKKHTDFSVLVGGITSDICYVNENTCV